MFYALVLSTQGWAIILLIFIIFLIFVYFRLCFTLLAVCGRAGLQPKAPVGWRPHPTPHPPSGGGSIFRPFYFAGRPSARTIARVHTTRARQHGHLASIKNWQENWTIEWQDDKLTRLNKVLMVNFTVSVSSPTNTPGHRDEPSIITLEAGCSNNALINGKLVWKHLSFEKTHYDLCGVAVWAAWMKSTGAHRAVVSRYECNQAECVFVARWYGKVLVL